MCCGCCCTFNPISTFDFYIHVCINLLQFVSSAARPFHMDSRIKGWTECAHNRIEAIERAYPWPLLSEFHENSSIQPGMWYIYCCVYSILSYTMDEDDLLGPECYRLHAQPNVLMGLGIGSAVGQSVLFVVSLLLRVSCRMKYYKNAVTDSVYYES